VPLPEGAIVIVCDSMGDALRLYPKAMLVAPEKWRAMEEELARLRALAERKKAPPPAPSKCVLKGKVEGGLVALQAQFELFTHAPRDVVALACGQAHVVGAALDGRPAALLGGGQLPGGAPEGFSVQVDKSGEHQLTLDLLLPLAARPAAGGGGPGFLLDLPRAAVTELKLELPNKVKDVRLGGRPLADTLLTLKGAQLAGSLGAADKLELSWNGAHAAGPAPVRTAKGAVQVRLDGKVLSVDAQLVLQPLGGQVAEWRVAVPARAEVKVVPADDPRVGKVDRGGADKGKRVFTVRLREPSDAPVTLAVHLAGPLPGHGTRVPVGPFTVLNATHQSGDVLVSNAAADLHLDYHLHGDLARRALTSAEQTRDPSLVAAFHYGQVSAAPAGKAPAALPAPWLELEAEVVRGQVRVSLAHTLTLTPEPGPAAAGRARWHLKTVVTALPRWADVGRLLVQMPPGCEYADEAAFPLPDGVRQVVYDRAKRTLEVRLVRGAGGPAQKPIVFPLEATYQPEGVGPSTQAGRATLALPRPAGAVEQGGKVTVRVPRDVELLAPPERAALGLDLERQTTHEQVWGSDRQAPERVEVSWQHRRSEVRVESVVDLTLSGGKGHVRRHELRYRSPQPRVTLRVPAAVGNSLRIIQGGEPVSAGKEDGGHTQLVRLVAAPGPAGAAPAHVLVLEYTFPLDKPAAPGGAVVLPLVAPEAQALGQTRVRVWCEPGCLPAPAGGPWDEQGIEEVPGEGRLPALVLRSRAAQAAPPLALRLDEAAPAVAALVERALVRVTVGEGGVQMYRARYAVTRLVAGHLDVELPGPVSALEARAKLDGKPVAWEAVDEQGRRNDGGHVARLRLAPGLVKGRSVLEVAYQLPPGRAGGGPLQTVMQPPVLHGCPEGVPTRWQVHLPSGWVALAPQEGGGGGPVPERTWGWRGWLLAPRLALTGADLQRWLEGPEGGPAEAEAEGEEGQVPSLSCWREGPAPLVVTHVPQQGWLLVCSLGLLVLGLGLSWLTWPAEARGPRGAWLWPALALLALVLVGCALLWPTVTGQVAYGCQPGALVLVVVAGAQWLVHERYRRRVIFLPSFSRARTGSSLQRRREGEGNAARPGEPSTVDAPRPAGSSVERGAGPPKG
jgi:hypothetical protein